jgi:class 3 adenylate cyclase/tetratricopeptide (TPR) repeat protein
VPKTVTAVEPQEQQLLAPFVSQLAIDWAHETPDLRLREVPGTLVFADISGFTRLTERLAAKGRFGAEEMSDILDVVLSRLLDAAYSYGGWLVKWGGDALLLMFEGDQDAERACAASVEMHRVMRETGQLQTTVGRVRLRMSVGVHTGVVDFLFVGRRHRELLVTGDAASVTAGMETTAEAGEIVVSPATAARLPSECRGEPKGDGVLLATAPKVARTGHRPPRELTQPVRALMTEPVINHLTAGGGSGEHRQVAVAFVEFRGVGALRESRGPAAVVRAIERLVDVTQEATHRYGVTFHETDIGPDGGKIMLVAGAPKALDNHAEAMLCTVREIVDDESPLAVRVGVTTGRVFTGSVGPAFRRSYSVKGDVVNMAARVMGKSKPGQIWAIEAVVPHSRTQFELEALPPFMVKGKTQPITAYAVGQPVGRGSEDVRLTLVGRDREIEAVREAVANTRRGAGAVIRVLGDAGLGKTRLLTECRGVAGDLGVISAAAEPFRASTPYALMRSIVTEALGLGSGTPEILAGRLKAWCAAVAPELEPWLPLLGAVIDVSLDDSPETRDLDDQFRKTRLEATVREALAAALPHPTLILIDDGHYADAASVDVVRHIADHIGEHPWLLVIARRASDAETGALTADVTAQLVLEPLDVDEARALVDDETDDHPLSPHVTDMVVARGGGNPLFLRELARAARSITNPDELPDSVENFVATQIDRLAPRNRDVLRAAAAIGVSVDPDLLRQVLAADGEAAVDVDWQPLHAFLHRDGDVLRFRQTLVQQAAYQGMPYRRRTTLHARLAKQLAAKVATGAEDGSLLAFHYFQAGEYADALIHAQQAAESAASAYANVEAAALYERALAAARYVQVDKTEAAQLRESLGDMRWRLGEFDQADAMYAAARRLAQGDAVRLGRLGLKAARDAEHLGKFSLALGRLNRAQRLMSGVEGADAYSLRLEVRLRRAFVLNWQGRFADARSACTEILNDADVDVVPGLVAGALRVLDEAEVGLGRQMAPALVQRAMDLYQRIGDLDGQARSLNHLGWCAYFDGRWTEALDLYEQSRQLLERTGDSWNAAVAAGNVAEIYADQGRLAEAETMLRSALRVWRASNADKLVAFGECLLGRLLSRQGRYADGWALLTQAQEHLRELGAQASVIDADAYAAECLLLQGRVDEALAAARSTLTSAQALSELPTQAPLLHRIVGAALDTMGDHDAANDAYAEALAAARERGATHEVAFTQAALVARARRAGQEVDPAWVAEAQQVHEALGLVLDLASLETRRMTTPGVPTQRGAAAPIV